MRREDRFTFAMPNSSITDALKEVMALGPNDSVQLETISLSHPDVAETIYMVQDFQEWNLTLEDTSVQTFIPVGFRFVLPAVSDDGTQEMRVAVDNTDRRITDFIESVGSATNAPVTLVYRPYLSSDPTTLQMDPPLTLYLTDIELTAFEASGRAKFVSVVTYKYPHDYYDRGRFPGLR